MNQLLDYKILIPLALLLGFAPFVPQPHIVEKIRMLLSGTLGRPIDIFDLFWHGWPFVLLTYRIARDIRRWIISFQTPCSGEKMQSSELLKRSKGKNPPAVIDVRTGFEFNSGHIPAAIHAPTWKILLRLARLPSDKNTELVITCEHGPRAQMAKGLLGVMGYRNVDLLDGHMSGWRRAGLPLEK